MSTTQSIATNATNPPRANLGTLAGKAVIWRAAPVTDIVELLSTEYTEFALLAAQTRGDNGQTATPSGSRCTNLQILTPLLLNLRGALAIQAIH